MSYYQKYKKYQTKYFNLLAGAGDNPGPVERHLLPKEPIPLEQTRTVSLPPPNHDIPLTVGFITDATGEADGEKKWYLLGEDYLAYAPIANSYPMDKDEMGTDVEEKHGSSVYLEWNRNNDTYTFSE